MSETPKPRCESRKTVVPERNLAPYAIGSGPIIKMCGPCKWIAVTCRSHGEFVERIRYETSKYPPRGQKDA